MCVCKIICLYLFLFVVTPIYYSANNFVDAHAEDESNKSATKPSDTQFEQDIDWYEGASTCVDGAWKDEDISHADPYTICYGSDELGVLSHVSMDHTIDDKYPKDQIPNSGPHRASWAVYGEYKYLPPGRFVHNLEHGAVAFLYHPCTPQDKVDRLRQLAERCTWQHVMSAYPKVLNKTYPMAIITYGCEYRMSRIDITSVQEWMKVVKESPEAHVYAQGTYNHSLLHASEVPQRPQDESGIPFCSKVVTPAEHKTGLTTTSPSTTHNSSSSKSIPKPTLEKAGSSTKTPRTSEAYWAVGSLAFLLTGLVAAVCYTQLWRKGNQGESFEKSRVWNDESTPGSVSVAAIVRKFPHMLKNKVKNSNILKTSQNNRYHRIVIDDDTGSEEEL